ncbi:radical SAM/SPASM domain-containing protein [Methanolobus bombayensis]|uniref:radical SAM/SPASM domain-containing protein n=1 Tax=Methanolobus bombayensis TaxID=38023 RepID=UPI002473659B|nr:radical SAM/SPASM domain-containing protein [Methanolobus bombayensis]
MEVTNHCNLKCIMCPREIMTRKEGVMDLELFKKVIDDTTKFKKPYLLTLHFSGEPLINKKLPEMIRYAKDKGVPIVKFNSNAMLLDEKMSEQILGSGLDILTIAIESTKDIHDKFRVGSDFEQVTRNVQNIVEMKKKKGLKKPSIRVQMLTSKDTDEKDIQAGIDLWEPIVDYVKIESISTAGGQIEDFGSTRSQKKLCKEIWTNMVILWNGDVTVCCVDHNAALKVGNVNESSIEEIWNGEKYQRLRDLHRKGDLDKIPLCDSCLNANHG